MVLSNRLFEVVGNRLEAIMPIVIARRLNCAFQGFSQPENPGFPLPTMGHTGNPSNYRSATQPMLLVGFVGSNNPVEVRRYLNESKCSMRMSPQPRMSLPGTSILQTSFPRRDLFSDSSGSGRTDALKRINCVFNAQNLVNGRV